MLPLRWQALVCRLPIQGSKLQLLRQKGTQLPSVCDLQRTDTKQTTGKTKTTHNITAEEDATPNVDDEYFLYHIPSTRAKPAPITVAMNNITVPMELDMYTGASLSIMSEQTYQNTWPKLVHPPICPTKVNLKTYNPRSN